MDTKNMRQKSADPVPSSSSGIQKSAMTKPVTHGDVGNKKVKNDNELIDLLKKQEVQELLSEFRKSANSALPLSNFKTPRKNIEDTELGKASSSPQSPVQLSSFQTNIVENVKKEMSETISNANQSIQSRKRPFSGVEVPERKANIAQTVHNQTTNFNKTSDLRPILKAKRTLPASLSSALNHVPSLASTATVDTPQRKLLAASRNKYNSRPQISSKSVEAQARPSETQAINTNNRISEILQIVKIEKPNVCVQLDTIDALDDDAIKAATTSVTELMIVVDTNVWIGHQLFIEELLEIDFQVLTRPVKVTVIIPWMVLQEIDRNKNSVEGFKFRGASKFIHGLLSKKHPRVNGEQPQDALIGNDFNHLMADDSILNCAIKCSKLIHVKTVMLTNDINLLNKALILGLAAFKANNELINNLCQCLSDTYVQVHSVFNDIKMKVNGLMPLNQTEFHISKTNISRKEAATTNLPQVPHDSSSSPFDHQTFEAVVTSVQESLSSVKIL